MLDINKTILNQVNFSLGDKLRVLKLNPVNFPTEIFEISFDQFIYVLESMQFNTTLVELEIGVRHGMLKNKIFNQSLYEKERKHTT